MTDEEKKFSLDELPDEGSEPAPKKTSQKPKKETPDPRVEKLIKLAPSAQVETMVQKWEFDEPIRSYTWVGFIIVLVVLEFAPFYKTYISEVQAINRTSSWMGDLWNDNAGIIEIFIKHPLIFLILLPLFYRGPKDSDYVFRISFDGIDTVKKILPTRSKELISRVFIKWNEVERVEKGRIEDKEILRLYSLDGHIGDLIWYIDVSKKKAIHLLLKGMIVPKHPLRIFLDNEKELK